ncbi:MAG: AGE family epimerase/isomerase [Elusimicrobia bacterium]|nr:AGE family epimerase/isomerase [Elusimicrobiota bacterium]
MDPALKEKVIEAARELVLSRKKNTLPDSLPDFRESCSLLLYIAAAEKNPSLLQKTIQKVIELLQSPLYDPLEGGFFLEAPNKGAPLPEKRLKENALWVSLLVDGYLLKPEESLRRAITQTLQMLEQSLWSPTEGGFFAQVKGSPPAGEALEIHKIFYADANAAIARTLFQASAALGEDSYSHTAEQVLQFLQERCVDPGRGICHSLKENGEAECPGALPDQAWTALAFVQASQHLGHPDYREFADWILKQQMLLGLWDKERGGFLNLPDEQAPSAKPALDNAIAIEVLWKLSHLKGSQVYLKSTEGALRTLCAELRGPAELAPFVKLWECLRRGRIELDLVGRHEEAQTQQLLALAHGIYLPRMLLSFIDPSDMDFILSHRLKSDHYPRLFVSKNGRCLGPADTREEIESLTADL